jgi:hypothetical protein
VKRGDLTLPGPKPRGNLRPVLARSTPLGDDTNRVTLAVELTSTIHVGFGRLGQSPAKLVPGTHANKRVRREKWCRTSPVDQLKGHLVSLSRPSPKKQHVENNAKKCLRPRSLGEGRNRKNLPRRGSVEAHTCRKCSFGSPLKPISGSGTPPTGPRRASKRRASKVGSETAENPPGPLMPGSRVFLPGLQSGAQRVGNR